MPTKTRTRPSAKSKYADWTDAELVQHARDLVSQRASEIAELAGLPKAAVEHGLYGYRWPKAKCGVAGLCDILEESRMILDAMRDGASLEAAHGAVTVAVGMRVHGGWPPKLTPPPAFPG